MVYDVFNECFQRHSDTTGDDLIRGFLSGDGCVFKVIIFKFSGEIMFFCF